MDRRGFAPITIVLVVLGLILLGAGSYIAITQPAPKENFIQCSTDAKLCPDGSSVGRTGLNCEFAECPLTEGVLSRKKFVKNMIEHETSILIDDNGTLSTIYSEQRPRSAGVWQGTQEVKISSNAELMAYVGVASTTLNAQKTISADSGIYIQNVDGDTIYVTPGFGLNAARLVYLAYLFDWSPDSKQLFYHIVKDDLCVGGMLEDPTNSPECEATQKLSSYSGFYVYNLEKATSTHFVLSGEREDEYVNRKEEYQYQEWRDNQSILFTRYEYEYGKWGKRDLKRLSSIVLNTDTGRLYLEGR